MDIVCEIFLYLKRLLYIRKIIQNNKIINEGKIYGACFMNTYILQSLMILCFYIT